MNTSQRCLYNRLRSDYQLLPSITTLTRITSNPSKVTELPFLRSFFQSVESNQKFCLILHDEVYLKKVLLYQWRSAIRKGCKRPCITCKNNLGDHGCLSLWWSHVLYLKYYRFRGLREQIDATHQAIASSGGELKAIISDGNRTNQVFVQNYSDQALVN